MSDMPKKLEDFLSIVKLDEYAKATLIEKQTCLQEVRAYEQRGNDTVSP